MIPEISGHRSPSGVFVVDDFRDNLIVDRYDPCFATMRMSKKKHLRSEHSEDALSWNVFRSLRQLSPTVWLPELFKKASFGVPQGDLSETTVDLWKSAPPPPSLLAEGDEGISEIDIVLENPHWVCFIEAKYTSDISEGTTTRPDRDQVLRNIDVGSYYAGTRDFYFALLVCKPERSRNGISAIERYRDFKEVQHCLPHRKDCLQNLRAVSLLTWSDLASVLSSTTSQLPRPDEAVFAERALEWLNQQRGICR